MHTRPSCIAVHSQEVTLSNPTESCERMRDEEVTERGMEQERERRALCNGSRECDPICCIALLGKNVLMRMGYPYTGTYT